MSNFLLIHGGGHGPGCWNRVIPYLEASSSVEQVVAADLLAGAQAATGRTQQELTSFDYVEGVVQVADQLNLKELVIVGHSMAGITIPEVCHRMPDRVKHVIYLTTSNPVVGQSIADLMNHPLSPKSRNVSFDDMFCNDLDEGTASWLKSHLREEPPLPVQDRVRYCTLPEGIPSTYIVCTEDLALPPEYQHEQARNARVDEVVEFHSGHSAFASRPRALAERLLGYA